MSEWDEIWQFDRRTLLYIATQTGEVWYKCPLGRQNSGVKKVVMLFSYTAWPSAMKFGAMTGIGASQVIIDREFVTSAKKSRILTNFPKLKKIVTNSYKNSLNARV